MSRSRTLRVDLITAVLAGFTGQVAVIASAPQMEAAWAKLRKMLEVR